MAGVDMGTPNKKNSGKKQKAYLEIYIEEDGNIILVPLTRSTIPVFAAITRNKKDVPGVYCG